jgi:nucleoside-diphosphate-sugar epimerase
MAGEPILVTGAAGFIGFCLARRLLENGRSVVGVDNVNSYYDPAEARLAVHRQFRISPFIGLISPIESWSSTSAEGGQSALTSRANS